jgi:hypothetical protein
VHVTQFNTETDFTNAPDLPGGSGAENAGPFAANGTQLRWLEDDLKSVNRKKTPWYVSIRHILYNLSRFQVHFDVSFDSLSSPESAKASTCPLPFKEFKPNLPRRKLEMSIR